jgi:hypothetical protein
MGYAEYEFGMIDAAKAALANLFITGQLEGFKAVAKPHNQQEVEVFGFCKIGDADWAVRCLTDFHNKGFFIGPKTAAWLSVAEPLFLLKDQSLIPQADLFLKPAISSLKKQS